MLLRSAPVPPGDAVRPGSPPRLGTTTPGAAGPTLLLVALVLVARALPIGRPPAADEVGYLMVAAAAHPHGPFLYGDLWVDRPPLLVAFFRLAGALGQGLGIDAVLAVRLLGLVAVALLVACAVDAGRSVAGARGGWWAGAVAAALTASPLLGAPGVDGELLAIPLVMASVALALRVVTPGAVTSAVPRWTARRPLLALAVAGALGAGAVDVKQNFAGGLVVVAVLLLARAVRGEERWRRAAAAVLALGAGALVVVVATVVWAQAWGAGASGLADALVGFRASSADVIASQSSAAPLERLERLVVASLTSGLAPVLVAFLALLLARRRPTALDVALLADLVWSTFSIAAGGSYWGHYLLQLVPVAALAAARLAPDPRRSSDPSALRPSSARRRRGASAVVALTGASTVVALAVSLVALVSPAPLVATGCGPSARSTAAVARWLTRHREPGDRAVLAYGVASVLEGTGLQPAYPYLWSLPVRVLDPDLRALTASVTGPGAATWVVRTIPGRPWGLDADGRLRDALADGYRPVLTLCGQQVLLRRGEVRAGSSSTGR